MEFIILSYFFTTVFVLISHFPSDNVLVNSVFFNFKLNKSVYSKKFGQDSVVTRRKSLLFTFPKRNRVMTRLYCCSRTMSGVCFPKFLYNDSVTVRLTTEIGVFHILIYILPKNFIPGIERVY